jgi:hypothetical protein
VFDRSLLLPHLKLFRGRHQELRTTICPQNYLHRQIRPNHRLDEVARGFLALPLEVHLREAIDSNRYQMN